MLPDNELIKTLQHCLEDEKLFLVGGAVRDMLINQSFKQDYDFLLEGDVFLFSEKIRQKLNLPMQKNKHLLTVSFSAEYGTVDIARARKEIYLCPGFMPQVSPASWEEDLQRRDFTINTLLIPLLPEGWGKLIDRYDGRGDIDKRIIRILHKLSFRDDPTRILRAIRLKNRLDFSLEEHTMTCLQESWQYIDNASPARRLKEWVLICEEQDTASCIKDIYNLGGWQCYFPGIPYAADNVKEIEKLMQAGLPDVIRGWYIILLMLLSNAKTRIDEFLAYWTMSKHDMRGLYDTFSIEKQHARKMGRGKLKNISSLPMEGIYYIYHKYYSQQENWQDFLNRISKMKLPISGIDLIEYGVEPGPRLGVILKRLEDCYWQGEFDSKAEGLEMMKKQLKEDNY